MGSKSSTRKGVERMKFITQYVPEGHIRKLDKLVRDGFYPNRAEAIRMTIRDLVNEEA